MQLTEVAPLVTDIWFDLDYHCTEETTHVDTLYAPFMFGPYVPTGFPSYVMLCR
jgi:hypothetical protein